MKRLKEQDYALLAMLQQLPEGLRFGELLEQSGSSPVELHKRLQRLLAHNLASTSQESSEARYLIGEQNEPVAVRKACCPICKTIKHVGALQNSTQCSNPACLMRSGLRRQYWLANADALRKGVVRPLNIIA